MRHKEISSFLSVNDIHDKLDRLFVVRIDDSLYESMSNVLSRHPALATSNRSAFTRKALIYALNLFALDSAAGVRYEQCI